MRTFSTAAQSDAFTITAELTLGRNTTADEVARQARLFAGQADGVQVADNPLAWVNMSALAASALLLQEGIDPIPILTCRDRNRIALTSDLLGLRALGVTSVLLTRGRRVPKKHPLHASTVFDLTARELIAMAQAMNEEGDGQKAAFFIGTGAKAHRARSGWRGDSLRARAEAGAQFLQTQICFDLDLLRQYMERLVQAQLTWRYSVIVSLTPLPSAETARWVKDNMLDSKIPDTIIERLEQADDPLAEGIGICAETMRAMAGIPGISGVNLMTTGEPEHIAAAIEASGLR
ncbi:MAG: hypothetical protein GTN86_10365 [Xanthomonadales bacterium]|nr:hypothetical protein [Xanthomonadales bacterium]NIN58556.1 hypothetical protein [Xanthomonadales bacterium]NIN73845.1 hypothetical protein [Xanthomonadales bacterium]NIO12314.1 hypothetical protein [Xanthomonadales bacterium]NIP10949.1 hypothetical protein [Xanthomonadales bacterium]